MKKVKSIISVALIGSMLLGFAGCAKVKAYDKKEIKAILKDDLEIKKDDIRDGESKDYEYVISEYGKAGIYCYIYEDEDDAADDFEDLYDDYSDDFDDGVFEGSHKMKLSKTNGYIVFDGEGTDDDGECFYEDEYYYGGIFFADNMIIQVATYKDKDSAREDVDAVLKEFGFPKP